MIEKNQEGQDQVDSASNDETKEEVVDIQVELELAKKEIEDKYKSEISGLNRKISETQKQLKDKELEGKSEAEKVEALRLEKEQLLKETEQIQKDRIKDKILNDTGLPLDFAKRIIGNDENEIAEDVKLLNEFIDKTAQERADKIINERLGGKNPEAGKTASGLKVSDAEFRSMGPKERASFMAKGGTIDSTLN